MKSKSLYFFGICCCLLIACKKDKDPKPTGTASLQVCSITSKTEGMYEGTAITRFTYSDDEKLLKEEIFNEGDTLIQYTAYEYDGDKKVKAEIYWTDGGTKAPFIAATIVYEYDASGNLIHASTTGQWCEDFTYEYSGALLTKESNYACWPGAQALLYSIEYQYDNQGRKIMETHFTGSGALSYGYTYEYKDGRLSKRYVFYEPNNLISDTEYVYDKNGNLIKDQFNTYTYDEFNRLSTAVIGGIDTVETKTYEYCE